jgi:hypothetical protein
MAQLNKKIELYAKANGVNSIDFLTDVILEQSAGENPKIKTWNLSIDEPTVEQLNSFETDGNTEEALQTVLNNRAKEYPSIVDQLDDIYHNGIDAWKATIKTTKDKYPKG